MGQQAQGIIQDPSIVQAVPAGSSPVETRLSTRPPPGLPPGFDKKPMPGTPKTLQEIEQELLQGTSGAQNGYSNRPPNQQNHPHINQQNIQNNNNHNNQSMQHNLLGNSMQHNNPNAQHNNMHQSNMQNSNLQHSNLQNSNIHSNSQQQHHRAPAQLNP